MKDKIVTLIPSLYDGGAEKFVADMSYNLSEKYDHTLLLYNQKENKYAFSGKLIELDVREENSFPARIRRQLIILKKIKKIKKTLQPKLTISHMLLANMLNLNSRKGSKTMCVLHGEWSIRSGHSKFLDWFIKKQYSRANMIIFVSHFIKNKFNEYYHLNVPNKVIYVGVDIKNIVEKAEEKITVQLPEKYIVYVAGFRPVKNHIQLIRQLEKYLKTTDMSLVLVGDGPLKDKIIDVIKECNLSEKIIITGNLSNPYPIIKKAFVSVLVSTSESFSLVVVESMALGTPVIATDCGGPREILEPEWTKKIEFPFEAEFGILIEKSDEWEEHSLVSSIQKLIYDEVLREKYSQNGKQRAESFSIYNSEMEYELVVDKLLKE